MKKTNHQQSALMDETMSKLLPRLLKANDNIDTDKLNYHLNQLSSINIGGNITTIGTGGSYITAYYASKTLEQFTLVKQSITKEPRDILYSKNSDNLIAFSWSGKTYAINKALEIFPSQSLLVHANKESLTPNEIRLYYPNMDEEKSFISIATTLIPMGEFLKIYLNNQGLNGNTYLHNLLNTIYPLHKEEISKINPDSLNVEVFEIMSGDYTYTASKALESSLTESGIGIPIVHEKYAYCHGRSNMISHNEHKHTLIYLINGRKEIDNLFLELLKPYYKDIILLESHYQDPLVGEYDLTLQAYLLCERIAKIKNMDISQVDYETNIVHKVYRYKGEL